jgi:hypothetical protein
MPIEEGLFKDNSDFDIPIPVLDSAGSGWTNGILD